MRTLSSFMAEKKNTLALKDQFMWLFDVSRDSSNISRWVKTSQNITFLSNTYTAKQITFQPMKVDAGGTLANFKITIADPDQTLMAYVMAGKFIDQKVAVRVPNYASLSTAADQVVFRGVIQSIDYADKANAFSFSCGSMNLRDHSTPRDKVYKDRCSAVFKSDECGYAGAETSCDKKFATCTTYGQRARFNGAPGMVLARL